MRVGVGYDIHKLVQGRDLILAGVRVPSTGGEEGFSDGDVLIHAIIDALFGAAALGDIGSHFPPGQEEYAAICSRLLLRKTRDILRHAGYEVGNVDCSLILEKPKILPFVAQMRTNLAHDLRMDEQAVSVKGKTKEGIGAIGTGHAVEAFAVALLQ